MLVMRRKEGEAIRIGEAVEIRILAIRGNRVKIGINAPRSIEVSAYEMELVRNENLAAAQAVPNAPEIVAHLLQACGSKEMPETIAEKMPEQMAEKTAEMADLRGENSKAPWPAA